ncbi:MAG: 16S rRNA (adenine(1518)-N(6)/adenine(1519)-N(6))-dimethyltransferase RsmA [Candidatus Marinimicrobia bacterium]|nr:16S rRNA (adenine(1518)-N(6)/adenine(1519)-N(6))-dimethyltransferase RsmA [Candidatus Neomarinimicrobiota bacterium]MBT3676782.1 16S rRNA (adenine(1518)-N(6)/adenine(1519)-N(6))-dimethyltransferase RsmA [Candidatus Neomarinimicrobiota bacterium]MBT3762656.1 16S rRNA (adenine(1518)-N(6)/adenine(1519)-N(6))-dimethyltransferase RsmA [Candidatus Neomarinimicrobiota bacterium]MBT4069526.1 16S rRNA (adenine(1518)-N(6)/adenine(1519)-N(6))-dimethyltransferase RsmA [Candidatus Neomarinimicrobiota bact
MKKSHPFRKKWGQNFLTDTNLLDRIVRTVDPQENDSILEIGPGDGSLTEKIFPNVKEMAVIEIDPLLIKHLSIRSDLKGLQIVHGDVLLQNIEDILISNPVRVVGNIPYNITSPIIFWLIEQLDFWNDAFIMMQKEVGQRLTAKIGTKEYSRLSIIVGVYLDVEMCFKIPPDVFYPKPKVDSTIIRFTKKEKPIVSDDQFIKFNKIVKAAFSMRRKMLRNSLSGFDIPDNIREEIDFTRRPETLSIAEFAKLLN